MKPLRASIGALAFSLFASACFAHAVAVESNPRDGATLESAPAQVEVRFNVRVEQALARATLRSGNGAPVPLTPTRAGRRQSERLIVPLPALGAGSYEVRYQVLASDGHTTQGVLRFRVAP